MSKSLSERIAPPHPTCRLPRLRTRGGRCYELAYLGAERAHEHGEEWTIHHGRCLGIGHAWLARNGQVFCPTRDRLYSQADYYASHRAEPMITYSLREAAALVCEHDHSGPWIDLKSPPVSLPRQEVAE